MAWLLHQYLDEGLVQASVLVDYVSGYKMFGEDLFGRRQRAAVCSPSSTR